MQDDTGPTLDRRNLEDLRARVEGSAINGWVGLELGALGDGSSEMRLRLRDHHYNDQGLIHGGILSVRADTCIGLALRSRLRAGLTHRTAQLDVHSLARGEGETIVGRGRAVHSGQRMGYGEADLFDA